MISICSTIPSGMSSTPSPIPEGGPGGGAPVRDGPAVDHDLDAAALGAQATADAAHRGIRQDIVVDEIEADGVRQHLRHTLVTPATDLFAGDDGDYSRSVLDALARLAGRGDLDVEELHQIQIADRVPLRRRLLAALGPLARLGVRRARQNGNERRQAKQ